jgi:hypothetical protein
MRSRARPVLITFPKGLTARLRPFVRAPRAHEPPARVRLPPLRLGSDEEILDDVAALETLCAGLRTLLGDRTDHGRRIKCYAMVKKYTHEAG